MARRAFGNRCVIFDIDGVLADCTHRLPCIESTPRDWESFFSAVSGDSEILHNLWMLKIFFDSGVHVALLTGRPERTRQSTENWLSLSFIDGGYDHLLMRVDGDYRIDSVIKREMLEVLRNLGLDVFLAFDDSQRVVDMYIEEGVPCHFVRAPDANKKAQVKRDGEAETQSVDDRRDDSDTRDGPASEASVSKA